LLQPERFIQSKMAANRDNNTILSMIITLCKKKSGVDIVAVFCLDRTSKYSDSSNSGRIYAGFVLLKNINKRHGDVTVQRGSTFGPIQENETKS